LKRIVATLTLALAFAASALAQDIASFEKRITTKVLPNGLTVVIMERPEAPVFSFQIHVDAGSAQDPKGLSGLAHMFEHMAFKGTEKIGTKDYAKEKLVLDKLEKAYLAYDYEKRKLVGRDDKKLATLEKTWKDLADQAQEYVKANEFGRILEENGAPDLNATTFNDETDYYYSLPSNRLELWAYLESERMAHPVYREFYKERDVVMEERRYRIDSSPVGRLLEQMLATAYTAHPYGVSGVGWQSEISSVTATDAHEFYKTYYTPANMVLSIVGGIKASEALPIIERYFGRMPKGVKPPELHTIEPVQFAERKVIVKDQSQPLYAEGYHRPNYMDKDDAVYDAISDILSSGRTSRMYRSLVRDKRIAIAAGGFSGMPGYKYPNLFVAYAFPGQGKSVDDVVTALHAEIDRLKNEDVTDDELRAVKTRAKANLLRGLASNSGLANQLATMQMRYGDWRELFRNVEKIDKVTKADIRRIAQKTFVPSNRTVGVIENEKPAAAPAAKGAE
jgi:predicted Zn-dependent peptidase